MNLTCIILSLIKTIVFCESVLRLFYHCLVLNHDILQRIKNTKKAFIKLKYISSEVLKVLYTYKGYLIMR